MLVSEMLNTKQAADYLNLSQATLEAWRCRGGGPVFRKFGKAVRYRKDDLDNYANNRVRTSTSEAA